MRKKSRENSLESRDKADDRPECAVVGCHAAVGRFDTPRGLLHHRTGRFGSEWWGGFTEMRILTSHTHQKVQRWAAEFGGNGNGNPIWENWLYVIKEVFIFMSTPTTTTTTTTTTTKHYSWCVLLFAFCHALCLLFVFSTRPVAPFLLFCISPFSACCMFPARLHSSSSFFAGFLHAERLVLLHNHNSNFFCDFAFLCFHVRIADVV